MILRKGVPGDVDQMEILEQQCFSVPWSKDSLLYELAENPLALYVVAEVEGRVAGYVGVWTIVDEGHITNVAVSPDFRGRHIGMALIDTMIDVTEKQGVKSYTLEVRASNAPAIGLYKKFGFVSEGLRKGYYEDNGEDAIIMWRR
ncbi:MAG: ribosomal protein S18-alanine N-acetyltransferase [Emergencia sp.]|nr:ribosomal protein S18-alanine N-acetyltransferase [Emergencia sp.]